MTKVSCEMIPFMMGRDGFEPPKHVTRLIYSQPPLTTWVPALNNVQPETESNRRPGDLESPALPTELSDLVAYDGN